MNTGVLDTDRAASTGVRALPEGGGERSGGEPRPRGAVRIPDNVVAKLAAVAAREIPDAGAAATRVLSRTVPGGGHLGMRQTALDALPKASAQVDDGIAFIELTVSVRWPAPVPQVTEAVRRHVREQVSALTGLDVAEVHIAVTDLVTDVPSGPRVR